MRRCDGTRNDHDGRDVRDVNISAVGVGRRASFRELVGPFPLFGYFTSTMSSGFHVLSKNGSSGP